jgi:hypothetical protein
MADLTTYVSGAAMDPSELPERMRPFLATTSPVATRLRAAGGTLPLPPDQLVPVLLYLSLDPDESVRKKAAASLLDMPAELSRPALGQLSTMAALDAAVRVFRKNDELTSELVVNTNMADDTVRWLAGMASASVCDLIGRNHVRALRSPGIIEALWLNPKASQGTVQSLLELAVRSNLALEHIAGFREVKAILSGEDADNEPDKGLSDSEFALAMAWATQSYEREHGPVAQVNGDAPPLEDAKMQTLQSLISKMSVSQKVRLAMVGDANVRKLLIRDPKKLVALAVLRSPRITEGEVTTFAGNKSLAEDLLTTICRNRNWIKDYATRRALVFNPKTPLNFSMTFLRQLHPKDLKDAGGSRDISQVIARMAKKMISDKQEKKG